MNHVPRYVIVTPLDENTPDQCRAACGTATDFPHDVIPHDVEAGECRCVFNDRRPPTRGQKYDG